MLHLWVEYSTMFSDPFNPHPRGECYYAGAYYLIPSPRLSTPTRVGNVTEYRGSECELGLLSTPTRVGNVTGSTPSDLTVSKLSTPTRVGNVTQTNKTLDMTNIFQPPPAWGMLPTR